MRCVSSWFMLVPWFQLAGGRTPRRRAGQSGHCALAALICLVSSMLAKAAAEIGTDGVIGSLWFPSIYYIMGCKFRLVIFPRGIERGSSFHFKGFFVSRCPAQHSAPLLEKYLPHQISQVWKVLQKRWYYKMLKTNSVLSTSQMGLEILSSCIDFTYIYIYIYIYLHTPFRR